MNFALVSPVVIVTVNAEFDCEEIYVPPDAAAALAGEIVQEAVDGKLTANVTVQAVGAPVPVVNWPWLLFEPALAAGGDVPQELIVGSDAWP